MALHCAMTAATGAPALHNNTLSRLRRARPAYRAPPSALRAGAIRPVRCFDKGVENKAKPAPVKTKPVKVDRVALVEAELDCHEKVMIAATAPAVRLGISEEFGLPPGTNSEKKLVTTLRQAGFDYVFDVNFAADLTIIEEGTELLNRLIENSEGRPDARPLPMFTSCCPGWIDDLEKKHGTIIPNVSTCKSPQGMMGAVVKNYFAGKIGRKPEEVSLVSIMPCVRKQGESDREQNQTLETGHDVDHALTTVEYAKLLRNRGIDLTEAEDGSYDSILGASSGAAQLFGTTGGVMEAALRTVYELVNGEPMAKLEVTDVRGLEGVKESSVMLRPQPGGILSHGDGEQEPIEVRVAVANGLGNAKGLVQQVEDGESPYHFIEVMACPGGCINGAGQPRSKDKDIGKLRQAGMYDIDERRTIRQSHQNPEVQHLYDSFLEEPNGHLAHKLLHTYYESQEK